MSEPDERARILIVDDDESTRKTLSLILEKKGYTVEVAGTGQSALERIDQCAFDAALLDIRLADMDGVELLAPFRQRYPDIVLIMATGYASLDTAIRAVNEGADGYVPKPLDMDVVLLKIRDLLAQQRLRRENRRLYDLAQQELQERRRAEQALRERERELATLMGNLPGMAYRAARPGPSQNVPEWTMEFVSEGCFDLTGYAPDDLLLNRKLAYVELILPEDRDMVQEKVQDALSRDEHFELTYRIVTAEGATRWVWERGRGIRGDDGGVRCLEGFIHDITERKQAEDIANSLYETSRALASSRDEDETIRTILRGVYRTLNCEHVIFSAVNEQAHTIGIRHGIWNGQFDLFPEWISLSQYSLDEPDILADIVHHGRAEIIGEWDDRLNRAIWEKFGHERFLRIFMPVRMQNRVLGVVEVGYDRHSKERIEQAEISALTAFADQLAVTLENTRLFVETEQRAARLQVVHEIDQAILTARSPQEIAQVALAHIRRSVPGTDGYVALLERDGGEIVVFAVDAERPAALQVGSRFAIQGSPELDTILESKLISDDDLMRQPDLPHVLAALRETGIRTYLAAPLRVQDALVGIMVIASERPQHFTTTHQDILREVSNQVAVALHNARLEAARRAESERLRTLIDNLPEGILLLAPDDRIVLSNPVGDELLAQLGAARDRPLSHLGSHPLADILDADFAVPLSLIIEESSRHLEVAAFAIESSQASSPGTLMLLRDVTELRQAQDLARQHDRLAAVGRLAGGVAHDFNNILTAITGYAGLIQDSLRSDNPLDWPPASELRADLEQVTLAARRAAALTRQLLIFSRKESVEPQVFDLNALVTNMAKMLAPLIGEHIQLELAVAESAELIEADPGRIEQVVMNLAINARDAMPHGGPLIVKTGHVEWNTPRRLSHARAEPGDYARLTVEDAGIGMSRQVLDHLFEPFFTTKAPGKGTGLGLAMVYGIVQQANGYVDVHSKPGKGTTFDVYIPHIAGQAQAVAVEWPAESTAGGSETILLVEDEDGVRDLARRILEHYGYTVLSARGPSEAILLSERYRGPIDLLLTDVVMPDMNGQDLAVRIDAQRAGIRVLFMSGYTGGLLERPDLDTGDDARPAITNLLQKPFEATVLAQRVREALGKPAASRAVAAPQPVERALQLPTAATGQSMLLRTLQDMQP
ncbi:MAG: response regulator, partial [Anaerolineae bacterium]|nr:response regulator [Anaerolineae bacterium]